MRDNFIALDKSLDRIALAVSCMLAYSLEANITGLLPELRECDDAIRAHRAAIACARNRRDEEIRALAQRELERRFV